MLVPDRKNFHELGSDFSGQQSAELDGNLNQVVESERKAGLEKMGQVHENFCGWVLVPFIINHAHVDRAKAPGLRDRQWVHIELILTHLRSHSRGSLRVGPHEHDL